MSISKNYRLLPFTLAEQSSIVMIYFLTLLNENLYKYYFYLIFELILNRY